MRLWLVPLFLGLASSGLPQGPSTLKIKKTEQVYRVAVTQGPQETAAPQAQVREISRVEFLRGYYSPERLWGFNGFQAAEQGGRPVALDDQGRGLVVGTEDETVYVIARLGHLYAQGILTPQAPELHLRLQRDLPLRARLLFADGRPVVGIRMHLFADRRTVNSLSKWIGSRVTDEQGFARWEHFAGYWESPEQRQADWERGAVTLQVPVVGGPSMTWKLSREEGFRGFWVGHVRDLGILEAIGRGPRLDLSGGQQFAVQLATDPEPNAFHATNGGSYRVLTERNQSLRITAIGGDQVLWTQQVVAGPTTTGEVVRVEPLLPAGWIPVPLRFPPVQGADWSDNRSVRISSSLAPFGPQRILFPWAALEQRTDWTVWIPAGGEDRTGSSLLFHASRGDGPPMHAVLAGPWTAGETRQVQWIQGYAPGAIPSVPSETQREPEHVLSGVVLDHHGSPVPGALVQVHQDLPRATVVTWAPLPEETSRTYPTDRDGAFQISTRSQAQSFRLQAGANHLGMPAGIVAHRGDHRVVLRLSLPDAGEVHALEPATPHFPREFRNHRLVRCTDNAGKALVRTPVFFRQRSTQPLGHQDSVGGRWLAGHTDALGRAPVPRHLDGLELALLSSLPDGSLGQAALNLSTELESLPMAAFSVRAPSVSGQLIDAFGTPVPGRRLKVVWPSGAPAWASPLGPQRKYMHPNLVPATTDADGRFVLYTVPDIEHFSIQVSMEPERVIAPQRTYSHGQGEVQITEVALGDLHVPLDLAWQGRHAWTLYELIDVPTARVVRSGSVRDQDQLTFQGLPAVEHRLRLSVPGRENTGPNAMDQQALILESEPISIAPRQEHGTTTCPPISLRAALQPVEVFGEYRGERFPLDPFEVFLTIPHQGAAPYFQLERVPPGQDPRLPRWKLIWVPKIHPHEWAAVATRWEQGADGTRSKVALRGGPVATSPGTATVVIPMQKVEHQVIPLTLGSQSLAALKPFRLLAQWQPRRVITPEGHVWISADSYGRAHAEGLGAWATPEGTVELSGAWAACLDYLELTMTFQLALPEPQATSPPARGPVPRRPQRVSLQEIPNTQSPGGNLWTYDLRGPLAPNQLLPLPPESIRKARHQLLHR